jgi:hypothetical protein|nr:MAG TPA_asm: restriction alleviation protein [Caudoviricetes sp.]
MCKYCDYENATLPWFQTINEISNGNAYDGINVDENGVPSLYLFSESEYAWDETSILINYCPFCGRKLK